ncbi:uncharacterized protein LOC143764886 isoform X1 [Ranitomeya variabilis]|uniref:uncharacterized protein LOC143764886 isoform X1 n=1 Tax=Ranitomeya variabilis TaxID=490064 RepID=UPI004055ED1C
MCPLIMDKDGNHVTKRILKLTLEIICLLTGEEYTLVKKFGEYVSLKSIMDPELQSWAHERKNDQKILELTKKITELLTEEVPLRCEDIMVCFTMEEWEYVEGHMDLYKSVMMEKPETVPSHVNITSVDTSETLKAVPPCPSINDKEGATIEDESRYTSTSDTCESPSYSLDCTEDDFDLSQDSNEKYGDGPYNQEEVDDKEMEESDYVSQQNNEEYHTASDGSGEDETNSCDWKLDVDYISKDCKEETGDLTEAYEEEMDDLMEACKAEMDNFTEDCKDEIDELTEDCREQMEALTEDCKDEMDELGEHCKEAKEDLPEDRKEETEKLGEDCKEEIEDLREDCKEETEYTRKDCKQEKTRKRSHCKYEDDRVQQYFEEELLKDVKIEVISDGEWEEETSWWGEPGRDIFMEESPEDIRPDLLKNRMIAEPHPSTFYPHSKKVDGGVSQDCQPPVLPGERANKSSPQAMLNCHINNGTATLNVNSSNCTKTFPPCQRELMSQFNVPASQEHVQIGQLQKNINTARKTTSDIQTLQNFLSERNENRRIEEMPHTELDTLLSKFILVVKRKDGNEYEPHTLRCMVGSIDRYLKEHSYNHTIIYGNSKDFPLTKQSLNAKIKFLKKIAESNPPIRQEALTDDDINNLYKTGTLSLDNPTSLLNLVFFNNGIHFALRTKEQYALQWGDIKLKIDSRGNQYLEYSDRQTETLENRKNVRQLKPRIYATPHIPSRDPVNAYLKYQSFRPGVMMTPDSPFYLAPNVNYNPAFSEWYRSTKIGIQKIRAMMSTMKIRASLPESKKKVSYITKRRLAERLTQHTLASGAMVPTSLQNHLHSFNNKPTVMDMKQHKPGMIINNLHSTLTRPSQERLPIVSSIQPHPSTSRYGELPVHKRSFLATQIAQQGNSNMYLNYRYLTSEEPATKRKPM